MTGIIAGGGWPEEDPRVKELVDKLDELSKQIKKSKSKDEKKQLEKQQIDLMMELDKLEGGSRRREKWDYRLY